MILSAFVVSAGTALYLTRARELGPGEGPEPDEVADTVGAVGD